MSLRQSNFAFKQYYYLFLILGILIVAEIFPWLGSQEGPLFPHITVKYIAVAIIFFTSGLAINTHDIFSSFKLVRLHLFIQVFSFGVTPFVIRLAIYFIKLFFDLDNWIVTGLIAVSCIPPPISSAVILTKAANGNEVAAILNSLFGCLLGIFLTPLLLLFHVGISCTLPVRGTILCLLFTAALPFLSGQLARWVGCPSCITRVMSLVPQGALLLVIFTSFCELFLQTELSVAAQEVLTTLTIVIIFQVLLVCLSLRTIIWIDSKTRSFKAEDLVAVIFCSAHKSLTLGLPLLRTLYGGYSHLSQISLPLLIYHPVQLILGALLAPYAQRWINYHSKSLIQLP